MKMPSDMLPVMLSTGVGVGLLGVVSGVCFLVYNGYAWTRRVKQGEEIRQKGEQGTCSSCRSSSEGVCTSCSLPVCNECSFRDQGQRKCQACCNDRLYFTNELENTGFLKLLQQTLSSYNSADNLYRSRVTSRTIGASKSESEIAQTKREEENRQVRDFLQKLAEHLVGGSLEDVTVGKMYDHPEYIRMFRRFHGPLCSAIARLSINVRNSNNLPLTTGPAPDSSHVKLQQLVQRVIEEALKLPALLDYSGINRDPEGKLPEFNPKTYEDLLATAILNKVIDRYQNDTKKSNGASSSGVHSGSSSPGEFGLGHRRKSAKRDSSPEQSSLEPMSQDDYVNSDSSGHISNTRILKEDLSLNNAYSTDEDDPHQNSFKNPVDGALSSINFRHNSRVQFPEYGGDIVEMNEATQINSNQSGKKKLSNSSKTGSGEIYANNNSWEDNWLFQKKKIKSQSVPVPMLIPNSNTEYKAMIGDRDADDTTDLSDLGSDLEETPNDIKLILLDSKSIIGGKNPEIVEILIDDNYDIDDLHVENTCKINEIIDTEDVNLKTDENGNDRSMAFYTENNDKDKKEKSNGFYVDVNILKNFDSDNTDSESNLNLKSLSPLEEKIDFKNITEATNFDVIDCKDDNNLESLDNQQQEGEYIETVDKPVQRHIDSLKRQHNIPQKQTVVEVQQEENEPPPLPSSPMPMKIETDVDIVIDANPLVTEGSLSKINKKKDDKTLQTDENDFELLHIPGSIAEREHKKWLNAVPMANNPYSPEAIQSRLEQKNKSSLFTTVKKPSYNETKEELPKLETVVGTDAPETTRYGRDYYINEAKKSTGAKKKNPDFKLDSQNFRRSDESDDSSQITTPISSAEITSYFESTGNDAKTANVNYANVYCATPIIIEDGDTVFTPFDDLYKKATKIEGEEQDIYILPVDLNDKSNVEKLLKMTNGTILTENFEQSDSISSLDDTPRIYNIETGRIIKKIKDELNSNATSQATKNEFRKSNGDLYSKFNISNEGIDGKRREKDVVNIPSVKKLAQKFINEEEPKSNNPITKPRRITREIKECEVKSSNYEKSVKQPQHMHSLTARSISKEFREELKLSMPVTNVHPGGSKLSPSKTDQLVKGSATTSSMENLQLQPGSLKNRLAYFENLSKK